LLLTEQNLTQSVNWHVTFPLEHHNTHHLITVLGQEKTIVTGPSKKFNHRWLFDLIRQLEIVSGETKPIDVSSQTLISLSMRRTKATSE
jgi:hypothetical protein